MGVNNVIKIHHIFNILDEIQGEEELADHSEKYKLVFKLLTEIVKDPELET